MNKRIIGGNAEDKAVQYLVENGYNILYQNYVCKLGEIDIVATNDDVLCFIEVKCRNSIKYGAAIESVNYKKQQKILKCAESFLYKNKIAFNIPCRFDVITIQNNNIRLIKNAFGVM